MQTNILAVAAGLRRCVALPVLCVVAFVGLLCFTPQAQAQRPPRRAAEKKEPPFEVVAIETKDGVRLRAAYFPSDKGKDAVPVMIVHEWGGQAGTYLPLGLALKKAGCAVLIPDLRGHGGSMTYPGRAGQDETFDLGKMGPADVRRMLTMDLESCKAFLKEKNDKEELNLNALTLIGVKEGCVLALEWAVTDWNFPSIGARKQGQDVKGFVLISPEQIHKGLRVETAFRDRFVWRLPTLVVAGTGSAEAKDADAIYKRLVKLRARVNRGDADGLELHMAKANASGAALLRAEPEVTTKIVEFVQNEIIANILKYRWVSRAE
ncbi:alpha/beta hydrolase [Roseimaritima sediminicola]|uniref:alpha/beta hydrolase n=1 Tax=Roseimaritima sediminicola TaxID=2662066 RepID=UPI00138700C1|nr:alpha/beta hydrolase [Roseimaritima sediminicola]